MNDGSELEELLQCNATDISILRSQYKAALELIEELDTTNADLRDVVRDCVNFLADLNSTSPFDSEYMEHRAKALHKRAYIAHSKAKENDDAVLPCL